MITLPKTTNMVHFDTLGIYHIIPVNANVVRGDGGEYVWKIEPTQPLNKNSQYQTYK